MQDKGYKGREEGGHPSLRNGELPKALRLALRDIGQETVKANFAIQETESLLSGIRETEFDLARLLRSSPGGTSDMDDRAKALNRRRTDLYVSLGRTVVEDIPLAILPGELRRRAAPVQGLYKEAGLKCVSPDSSNGLEPAAVRNDAVPSRATASRRIRPVALVGVLMGLFVIGSAVAVIILRQDPRVDGESTAGVKLAGNQTHTRPQSVAGPPLEAAAKTPPANQSETKQARPRSFQEQGAAARNGDSEHSRAEEADELKLMDRKLDIMERVLPRLRQAWKDTYLLLDTLVAYDHTRAEFKQRKEELDGLFKAYHRSGRDAILIEGMRETGNLAEAVRRTEIEYEYLLQLSRENGQRYKLLDELVDRSSELSRRVYQIRNLMSKHEAELIGSRSELVVPKQLIPLNKEGLGTDQVDEVAARNALDLFGRNLGNLGTKLEQDYNILLKERNEKAAEFSEQLED